MSSLSGPSSTSKPRCSIRREGLCGVVVATMAPLFLSGCSEVKFDLDKTLDDAVQKVFEPRRTPQQYMLVAVSDSDADARRAAIAKVAKSKKSGDEWAVKGYMAMALLEPDPQTRCVAIRGLSQIEDPRAAHTVIRILNHANEPPAEVRQPDAESRWEAAEALAELSVRGQVPADSKDLARTLLLERLRRDDRRQVRIASARALGHYPHADAVRGLIDGLRDSDFAVNHQAEESLVRLTGHTEHCNPDAWETWLAANNAALFANAGQVPPTRRPAYSNSWEKMGYEARQMWEWLVPAKK